MIWSEDSLALQYTAHVKVSQSNTIHNQHSTMMECHQLHPPRSWGEQLLSVFNSICISWTQLSQIPANPNSHKALPVDWYTFHTGCHFLEKFSKLNHGTFLEMWFCQFNNSMRPTKAWQQAKTSWNNLFHQITVPCIALYKAVREDVEGTLSSPNWFSPASKVLPNSPKAIRENTQKCHSRG